MDRKGLLIGIRSSTDSIVRQRPADADPSERRLGLKDIDEIESAERESRDVVAGLQDDELAGIVSLRVLSSAED